MTYIYQKEHITYINSIMEKTNLQEIVNKLVGLQDL